MATLFSFFSSQWWLVPPVRRVAKTYNFFGDTASVTGTETLRARVRLSSADRAAFAVTSRLLSSLVTEALLRAVYVPVDSSSCAGICVILTSRAIVTGHLSASDIYAIIPLHHKPVLKDDGRTGYGRAVWLLDPLDMCPSVWYHRAGNNEEATSHSVIQSALSSPPWTIDPKARVAQTLDPAFWWNRFAEDVAMDKDLQASLLEELISSCIWQKAVYDAPPPCPTLSSPTIHWEQCIIEGHPTHPMHRARRALPPLPDMTPETRDWYRPHVRFATIDRSRLDILGPFEDHIRELAQAAAAAHGKQLPDIDPGRVIMPVYDLQICNLQEKFTGVTILDAEISLKARAQASLRTVTLDEFPLTVKLPVGLKVSSALRTISHFTANIGPRFSEQVVPYLAIDSNVLHVESEVASAVCVRDEEGATIDQDIAKHFTAIFRRPYLPTEDEAIILAAALGETGHANTPAGVPVIQHILDLNTHQKRLVFFDEYTRLLLAGIIPPLLQNGLAFEAHPQNTLVRISRSSGRVLGFVMRDLGGIRVHPPTLRASTGVNFSFLPEHCIVTETREEAAKKLYHTLVFNHVQRLARVLDVHYNGAGWAAFRRNLQAVVPRDSWLWSAWMADGAKSVSGKCLVRMKLAGLYRDSVYEPFPNMIQFRPEHLARDTE
ncbi:IucC family-domain-containing protein [Vararia minispora EC-137]|uniref:IucC family-domain-containing protein n=1 Tax=Vararia minispora EC-137 TaxID=1314806 RepID=A0ACB8QHM4_9AGAM|nr:IucC family-domain-containing protein [Vararia minispora EC-137]